MTFGDKLSRLRKQNGYTQKELADALGVSLRTITNYETGGRYPKQREVYMKLADLLHVDINYLLAENEKYVVYAHEDYGVRGINHAQRLLAELRGLFTGGELAEEDKDEMMRAVQDAYWIAKDMDHKRKAKAERRHARASLREELAARQKREEAKAAANAVEIEETTETED